jgi:hypothetical protein
MSSTKRARGRPRGGPREAADEISLHQSFAGTGVGTASVLLSPGDRHSVGIELPPVGYARRRTFGRQGETVLTDWMADNALVSWVVHP